MPGAGDGHLVSATVEKFVAKLPAVVQLRAYISTKSVNGVIRVLVIEIMLKMRGRGTEDPGSRRDAIVPHRIWPAVCGCLSPPVTLGRR